jgi:nodulation protein F
VVAAGSVLLLPATIRGLDVTDQLAETIITKIKTHASPDAGPITLDTELDELGIHSLELTEIIFDIEDEFDIQVDMNTSDAWDKLKNVGDLVEAVRGLVARKA